MQLFMFNIGSQFHRIQKFLIFIIVILLSLNVSVKAQPMGGILTYVEEQDGVPSGVYWKLIFPNDTVTDNGDGTVTISVTGTGGGDITDVGDATTGAAFTPNGPGNVLYFEGPTADDFETILQGQDVSADVTLNLPTSSGTLLTKEQIDTEGEFESLLFSVITPSENNDTLDDLSDNSINDLSDVTVSSPSDGQLLKYNGTSAVWENWTPNYLTSESDPIFSSMDTEAELESHLTDVTNVYTNNDGSLSDDDLSDNSINDLSDVDITGWAEGKLLKFDASGSLVVGTDKVNDADSDPTNELQNIFQKVSDGTNVATADSTSDTLTFEAGTGISISVDEANDKVTIASTGGGGEGDITAVGDVISGDAFTADGSGNVLYFEGPTADAYETILQGQDVSSDVTINLPSSSGTLLNKEQIDTEAEFESLLFSILTPSEALLLDQTTPQTISNDVPLLDTTPTGTADIKSLVNKEYVDLAVTSLGATYYMHDDDDATGYKTCYLDPSSSAETYIEKTNLSDDDYIGGWISAIGEAPAKLLKGVYNWYVTLEKTAGTQDLRVYWKLVERKTDNSETIIATSSKSNLISSKGSYIVPLQLNDDYIPDSGSRIVGKLYADVSGGGSAPTVRLYYQGNTSSRWEIPANSEIFKRIFVPYDGAVKDVDLGSHDLTTTGTIDGGAVKVGGTDVLTQSTSFSGDVSGAYNNLQLGSGVVTSTEIADGTISEAKLDIYNAPTDGYYLKWDATNGMTWDTGGDITAVGNVTSGDAFTPDGGGNELYFEGATADAYEIKLTAQDPTADYTITLPAATGTVELQENIDTEAELESRLTDVTNVYTNNDGSLTDDDLSDNSINDLSDVDTTGVADGKILKYNGTSGKWEIGDDADTIYSAGTGLSLSGTTFSLSHLGLESLSDPNANRLYYWDDSTNTSAWLDYSAWDTDASDDLTTSTSFGGDVSGTYDNLQLGTGVVTTTEIADGTIADGDINANADVRISAIEVIIDGGDSAITTGVKADIEVPFNCTILQATALANETGSIQVDIWKDTYANFPPTDADSITGSNPITISSSNKSQDSTLSGWTTTISAGDILRFNVDSCSSIKRCTISLKVRKD